MRGEREGLSGRRARMGRSGVDRVEVFCGNTPLLDLVNVGWRTSENGSNIEGRKCRCMVSSASRVTSVWEWECKI